MWIMTPYGFFSVVCAHDRDPETPGPDYNRMVIRARNRDHLESLKKTMSMRLPRINCNEGTDYPFRITMDRDLALAVITQMAGDVDYTNFKDEAKRVSPLDKPFHAFLMEIWKIGHSMSPKNVRGALSRHPWRGRWHRKEDLSN